MKFPLKLNQSMYGELRKLLLALPELYPCNDLDRFRDIQNIKALLIRINLKMLSVKSNARNKKLSIQVDINEYLSLKAFVDYFESELEQIPYYLPFIYEMNEQLHKKFYQEHGFYKSQRYSSAKNRQVPGDKNIQFNEPHIH